MEMTYIILNKKYTLDLCPMYIFLCVFLLCVIYEHLKKLNEASGIACLPKATTSASREKNVNQSKERD